VQKAKSNQNLSHKLINSRSKHKSEHNLVAMLGEHLIALNNFHVDNTTVCVNLNKMATYLSKKEKFSQKYNF
jgi:hypothetical protein